MELTKQAQKMWDMVTERNGRFTFALSLMNVNQVNHLKELFNNIESYKREKKQIQKYIDIAIECDDYEGELYYQSEYGKVIDNISYLVRAVEEYINMVIKYETN